MIGEHLGLPSIEVNKLLQKAGYLTGKPGDWIPTSMAQGLLNLGKTQTDMVDMPNVNGLF